MRALLSIFAVSALTIACGNNAEQAPPATPAQPTSAAAAGAGAGAGTPHDGEGKHAGGGHEDHGKMNPALHDFHEVLKPVWHSTPGAERTGKACGAEKDLTAKAAAVGDAELTSATDAVKAACATPDKKDVEAKLSTVHDRFHKLVEKK